MDELKLRIRGAAMDATANETFAAIEHDAQLKPVHVERGNVATPY